MHASSSSATRYVTSASARCPTATCSTVRGAVLVLEKLKDAASSSWRRATCRWAGSIAVSFPMPLSTAASATLGDTSESSLRSSQRPVHLNEARPSDRVIERVGESDETILSLNPWLRRSVVPDDSFLSELDASFVDCGPPVDLDGQSQTISAACAPRTLTSLLSGKAIQSFSKWLRPLARHGAYRRRGGSFFVCYWFLLSAFRPE